ncbi:hypothetical protein A2645_01015 [Candidatus Nomurabacteria bacterium RIFCSPHIGHO2_01_FULL_39_9]|uniref:Uncharacterized protein n=1 Tax=Candidatus Nomurabacteria bacterium RIFCSPHIGHO2_01_FULL_39_9 TaxID=1801735 RepID=A0A1F6UWW4_9BACT|nr:MAG: hypothetical protein A2645_01015 [Candidatus Nomurabacteria bacterium RIFCSPHIGHO2_01_FULL_39_9]
MKKGFVNIVLIIVIVLIAGGAGYYFAKQSTKEKAVQTELVVQEEQKEIKDIVLPSAAVSTTLPTPYISAQENWPPVIQNSSTAYSCTATSSETSETAEKIINGRTYCITDFTDCGAGSCYSDRTYVTADSSGTKTTNFTLRYQNCGGYGGPGDTEFDQCSSARSNFNLDEIIDSLM